MPAPRYSAMSPYDITRPSGIESTTSSTRLAKSSTGGAAPSLAGLEVKGLPRGTAGPAQPGQAGRGRGGQHQEGEREYREQDELASPPRADRRRRDAAVVLGRGHRRAGAGYRGLVANELGRLGQAAVALTTPNPIWLS